VLGGGLYLWWKQRAAAVAKKPPSDCYNACDAQEKLTGVPAAVCKLGCDFFTEHPFTCPEGTVKASDQRAGAYDPTKTTAVQITDPTTQMLVAGAAKNSGYTVAGIPQTCVPIRDPKAPLPPLETKGTQSAYDCATLPATVTWDAASSSWRRMRAGETRNLGPCGTTATGSHVATLGYRAVAR